jgi:hypothetical protein
MREGRSRGAEVHALRSITSAEGGPRVRGPRAAVASARITAASSPQPHGTRVPHGGRAPSSSGQRRRRLGRQPEPGHGLRVQLLPPADRPELRRCIRSEQGGRRRHQSLAAKEGVRAMGLGAMHRRGLRTGSGDTHVGERNLQLLRRGRHLAVTCVDALTVLQARGVLDEREVRRAAQVDHRAEHHRRQRQQARPRAVPLRRVVGLAHVREFPDEQQLRL